MRIPTIFPAFAFGLVMAAFHAAATEPKVQRWQAQTNDPQVPWTNEFTLPIQLSSSVVLLLRDNTALSPTVPDSESKALAASGNRFLKGRILGSDTGWARLNLLADQLSGLVFDGHQYWIIEQAGALQLDRTEGLPAEQVVAFPLSELDFSAWFDHGGHPIADSLTNHNASLAVHSSAAERISSSSKNAEQLDLPITVVLDAAFSEIHGDRDLSVVLGRINIVDGIFLEQVGIGVRLWHLERLAAEQDFPATSVLELLKAFNAFMREGAGSKIPFRGLAHLLSGKFFRGTVGAANTPGIGQSTAICSSDSGYGVETHLLSEAISALLLAHEIGHNFSAQHDDDENFCPQLSASDYGIMKSTLSSNTPRLFSECSQEFMKPAVNEAAEKANCLVVREFVFSDDFEPAF